MKIKALIIEDEHLAAQKLERMVRKLNHDVEVVKITDSVESSVSWLRENSVNLIFCDIHLGDGISFSIFDQIELKTPIIFTTAYDQYALQAFKLTSIDYLLKPINATELEKAFDKFLEMFAAESATQPPIDFSVLMDAVQGKNEAYQERFMVYLGEKIITVNTEEIAYFYAEGKYVFMVTKEGKEHVVDYTLDRLTQKLEPSQFFRVNRQFIVTLKGISEMFTYTKSRVKLNLQPESKKQVVVSGERSADFKRWLNK